MRYYLAIDIGASSGRHIIGYLENGKLITEEIYRFQNAPSEKKTEYGGENPHLTWNVDALFSEIINGLKVAKDIGKIPEFVGIDTWGVDYVLLDENDSALGSVYCYRDSRTDAAMDAVHKIIPAEELYSKTGIQIAGINTVYQLFCDRESGKMAKACSMLMLPDFFNFKLTGIKRQEYTNSTTTGMINTELHAWDEDIINKLGFKPSLFGKLSLPGEVVGEFSTEIAHRVGYSATVILPATHDTASAVVAAPISDNSPYISSGTWSLLGIEEKTAHTSSVAYDSNYSNEGSYDKTFRLQKNIMGLWMIQEVRHETKDKYSFAELAEMAKSSQSPFVLNVNDKRFLAPKNMTEEINSAVGEKLDIGKMAFVIYNSLAISYAEAMDDLEKITGKKYDTLNIIGGGSKNGLLNRLTKMHTKRKIITGPAEGTAIGNLVMQMVGTGALESVKCGREIIKKSFDIEEI